MLYIRDDILSYERTIKISLTVGAAGQSDRWFFFFISDVRRKRKTEPNERLKTNFHDGSCAFTVNESEREPCIKYGKPWIWIWLGYFSYTKWTTYLWIACLILIHCRQPINLFVVFYSLVVFFLCTYIHCSRSFVVACDSLWLLVCCFKKKTQFYLVFLW
jgi:hypothetical protein